MHHHKDQSGNERVYALDALRGIMMLLGIVLHAASSYSLKSEWGQWPVKDPDMNFPFLVLVEYIHAFRMPVFFVAAGFFGALLFYKKGPKALFKNRFQRIVLPFIACVFLLLPINQITVAYSLAVVKGSADPFGVAWQAAKNLPIIPEKMGHLWFLYFLVIFALGSWLLAMLFRKETVFTTSVKRSIAFILKHAWLRIALVTACYFLMLVWMGTAGIITSNKWVPNVVVLLLYFLFFNLGWMIYKTDSLQYLKTNSLGQLVLATLLFLAADFVPWQNAGWQYTVKQLLTAVSGTLFIFGFIAFFLTYFHSYSKRLSYLMEASYWVYLIHLPFALFIPGLLIDSGLPVFIKFLVTLIVTSVICMLSYKYFVRGTFIGMFLNGKVHKTKKVK
jgi:glucan biosynthesis protein C